MRFTLFAAATAVLCVSAATASAVDIVNKDTSTHQLVITSDGVRKTHTVKAGEVLKDVCQSCTVDLAQASREVSGAQVVTILSGRLLVGGGQSQPPAPTPLQASAPP